MKADRPSETALRIAGSRVAAMRDPVLRKVLSAPEEPYSEWFVRAHSGRARLQLALWKWGPTRRLLHRITELLFPGAQLHILLRKRYVEDTVRAALTEGVTQVVIFGGGLDPLALRLAPEFPAARFIEIDHPATQAVKRRALEAHGVSPANVTLLPVDFSRETAEEALRALPQFDPGAPSLYLAEGLLMYLDQKDVDALFAAVRRLGTPGTRFLFSVLDAAALADPEAPLARSARMLERVGEPVRWAPERKKLDGYVKKHGFRSRSVVDSRT
ncbi:MAG TPA: class I SAM-dependent methyltransferase, partial [Armatimonadota bacterium]|nr:class I SAM-dependent methyltransferase [Armatimonadota bacterium]